MPKLLQINCDANWGSTGRIAEQIGILASSRGWDSYIAYGRDHNPSRNRIIKVGNKAVVYEHYLEHRFLDREGLASIVATNKLIRQIKEIQPDIIHLHNIHDHWLNFPILFEYLSKVHTPIVWTFHDLWATTGHCGFSIGGCEKWKTGCHDCPVIPHFCLDRSRKNYNLKKAIFTSVKNMTIVPVSEWLRTQVQQSFLRDYPMKVIKNGVDINVFKPFSGNVAAKYGINGNHILLGVSSVWPDFKGLKDFVALSKMLPDDYRIVLVGLSKNQISQLPPDIIGIERTDSQLELAQLYSSADIVLSLSLFETFGLTIAEGMACGTPAIVYGNAALPELITPETGCVVESGNVLELRDKVVGMISGDFKLNHSIDCRKRAEDVFDKNKTWESCILLYNKLLTGGGKIILLGVAAVWNDRKGFDDYIKLSKILPENYLIIMVGVSKEQKQVLPSNIIGVERTQNQYELAQLYSLADILLSLSTGETFGMTMAEAYACGTPCIVNDNTAQPEIVTPETGRVVRTGDIPALYDTIKEMVEAKFKDAHSRDCRKLAEECFDKDKCFERYVDLFNDLVKK